jgi:hypothetical protein
MVSVVVNFIHHIPLSNLQRDFLIIQHEASDSKHPFVQDPVVFVGFETSVITTVCVSPPVVGIEAQKQTLGRMVSFLGAWAGCAWEIVPPGPDEAAVALGDLLKGVVNAVCELMPVSSGHGFAC